MRLIRTHFILLFLLLATAGRAQSIIRTIAGSGTLGGPTSGDGGQAYGAALGTLYGVCVDTAGNVYYSDYANKVVKKMTRDGILSTIAGNGVPSSVSNPDANGDGGPASASRIIPQPIILDKNGNLYIGDAGTATVRKISTNGIITTFAGNRSALTISGDGGPATAAGLGGVSGLAFDRLGNLYIACGNAKLRKVGTDGMISTVVNIPGTNGYSGDGGPATAAACGPLLDVAFDSSGNMYIADGDNFVIRKISPAGIITKIAGTTGSSGTSGDGGAATNARFTLPTGIEADPLGNLYVSDFNKIRVINTSGVISTYAGGSAAGYAGDGAPPSATTRFNGAGQLSFDKRHYMYIPDKGTTTVTSTSGRRIRQVFQRDTFDITVSPSAVLCGNTSATFTAHPRNAYYNYMYRWYVNGLPVGSNSTVYSSTMVHNLDAVTCSIIDTNSGGMVLATSDTIVMTVLPPVNPELTVTSTGDTVCLGLPITFTASSTGGGSAPVYQWYIFGAPYATGSTFTYTPLVGQIVSCVLTSNNTCAFPNTDTVHRALSVIPSFHPYAEITASPDALVDYWSQIVTFFCEITYGGSDPQFQWYKNNAPIPGATSQTYFEQIYAPASYYCVVNSNGYCAVPALDTSNVISLSTGTLGISTSESLKPVFSVYPNPNNGSFTVAGTFAEGNVHIAVRNVMGQVVYATVFSVVAGVSDQRIVLDASVVPGIYSVHISNGSAEVVAPIVVQR